MDFHEYITRELIEERLAFGSWMVGTEPESRLKASYRRA